MTVDNYLAEAAGLAALAGILAGFALAAVVQFLTVNSGGKLATAGIVVFSAASVMFLYSLIVAVLSLSAAAELTRVPTELDNLHVGALLIMFGAIYVFVGGIGMAVDAFQNCRHPHNHLCPHLCLFNNTRNWFCDFSFYVKNSEICFAKISEFCFIVF